MRPIPTLSALLLLAAASFARAAPPGLDGVLRPQFPAQAGVAREAVTSDGGGPRAQASSVHSAPRRQARSHPREQGPQIPPYRDLARGLLSGERAYRLVAAMDPSYRVPGNTAFDAALDRVRAVLEEAGYVPEPGSPSARLTYRVEHRPMSRPTWEPLSASLALEGQNAPLMTLASNLNLVAANSFSTSPAGVTAEVVDVGSGSPEAFEGADVRGRIVLGDASVGQLFREAVVKRGALGVLAYRIPAFNRPEEHPRVAPMSSIPYEPEAGSWGLLLSLEARNAIREALRQGPVAARVSIETRLYPSEERTLVAEVRGSRSPDERFVLSAHVQESGANDNASGVALLAEMARAFAEGVRRGAFDPERSITMIWGDEITSTRRYLEEDTARAQGVRWGMSLDMVGENTEKTGGTFLIEKMPDPSAVWTRGDDHHTEWGGRPLTVNQLTPHYFNDFVLNRCREQAADTGWDVRTNPFEGGSDHVPFLRAGIPGVLLWHFTDVFYHTDGDRLEMVSAATLENVGVCAAASVMTLTTAGAETAVAVVEELVEAARNRLRREEALSRTALAGGGEIGRETLILDTWSRWYQAAIERVRDLEIGGPSPETQARIREAVEEVARMRASLELGGAP